MVDIRKKETLSYEEALHHLYRLLNAETYNKITAAIRKEMEQRAHQQALDAVSAELSHQDYLDKYHGA